MSFENHPVGSCCNRTGMYRRIEDKCLRVYASPMPSDLNIVQRPFTSSFNSGLFSQAEDDIFICG